MSASRGNKTGREKASKTNHVQNGKTEPIQIGSKNQVSQLRWLLWVYCGICPSQLAVVMMDIIIIIIIIIINGKIKVMLNTNVAGALYKNYQTK